MTTAEVLATAFDQISAWMIAHDAPLLVANLAPGATSAQLAATEAALGFALPADLRALWSLHDGQREEGSNGFIEHFCLLPMAIALAERETVMTGLEMLREDVPAARGVGLTADELASSAWVLFAGMDSDGLAVCGVRGRVFEVRHDDWPTLRLVAESVSAWVVAYAARVVADDYRVTEGFGDYYLERRDREQERQIAAREDAARAYADRLATRPLPELLADAIARSDDTLGHDVMARARAESPDALDATLALLFDGRAAPKLVAATLRRLLAHVDLSPAHWQVVADGGAQLGNNSIRDFARARAKSN